MGSKSRIVFGLGMPLVAASLATAQPLGSFTWQLQPYCNRVTVTVTQNGGLYTLDGFDDQCGAGQRAPLVGLATPNPDGTIGFGLNIVLPTGQAGTVEARISLAGLSGTWRDSGGATGTFALGANTGGSPRPAATPGSGDITGVTAGSGLSGGGFAGDVSLAVNPALVQSRVTTACPAGQALRTINQNGTAVCEPVGGGGDITAVAAGAGLTGGGIVGDVSLAVAFSGAGVANAAARSDHTHAVVGADSTGVGGGALQVNTGVQNTAVGASALAATTTGFANTALGRQALQANVVGTDNTAVGRNALAASTASENTAIGSLSLDATTSGARNTGVGEEALGANTTGSNNVAVGEQAGFAITTGSGNTFLGARATAGTGTLANASAIGANALVAQNNALVLGSINGVNGATADVNVGIGTTAPDARLDIASEDTGADLRITVADGSPDIVGRASNGTRAAPTAAGVNAALLILRGQGHTGTGFQEGASLVLRASEPWTATANGAKFEFHTTPNGTTNIATRMVIDHDGEVGIGTTTPAALLHVAGTARVDTLGAAGATPLCRNASFEIATCSSSRRYKHDLADFGRGLDVVHRLRPVSFRWNGDGSADVGFGAEDVAAIDPRFAVFNPDGSVEGVKYDRLTTVLVNAVKELEAQNDSLVERNQSLEQQMAALAQRLAALELAAARHADARTR